MDKFSLIKETIIICITNHGSLTSDNSVSPISIITVRERSCFMLVLEVANTCYIFGVGDDQDPNL